jgi:hypothetical protein
MFYKDSHISLSLTYLQNEIINNNVSYYKEKYKKKNLSLINNNTFNILIMFIITRTKRSKIELLIARYQLIYNSDKNIRECS